MISDTWEPSSLTTFSGFHLHGESRYALRYNEAFFFSRKKRNELKEKLAKRGSFSGSQNSISSFSRVESGWPLNVRGAFLVGLACGWLGLLLFVMNSKWTFFFFQPSPWEKTFSPQTTKGVCKNCIFSLFFRKNKIAFCTLFIWSGNFAFSHIRFVGNPEVINVVLFSLFCRLVFHHSKKLFWKIWKIDKQFFTYRRFFLLSFP